MSFPKSVWRWAFYDFANSSYTLTYAAFLLPVYFSTVLITKGYSLGAWGVANAIATVIGVGLSVFLGRYSDKHVRYKVFFWSVISSFVGMLALAWGVKYAVNWVYWLFVITNAVYILSLSISDSVLPFLASKSDETHEYSGFAWGFGYLGGIGALILVVLFQKITGDQFHPLVFASTAVFYLYFSLYSLRGLKDVNLNEAPVINHATSLINNCQRFWLLLGCWLISEAITVIIMFMSIYLSKELGFSMAKIGAMLLVLQLLGFPTTWFGGRLAQKYSPHFLLGLTIICWGVTVFFLVTNLGYFSVAGIVLAGSLAVGNSQSFLRSQYSLVTHRSEAGFQFGIYTFASKASVLIGPVLYGFAGDILHSQKIPLIILFATMVLGFGFVWRTLKQVKIT